MTSPASQPERTTILYVIIDRHDDLHPAWHNPNIDGVRGAAAEFDPALSVEVITIGDLAGMNAQAVDERWHPLAIVSAGSWSEWFEYGADATWRAQLDGYMSLISETSIPVHAFCGSHQLMAATFNGWSAVAHMNDGGPPVLIAQELAADPPSLMTPAPRVGEQGTYPLRATPESAGDPLVAAGGQAPFASLHHCDEVVDASGFTLLYESDPSREAGTNGGDQARTHCRVQGMKLAGDIRVLYSTQFHPEIARFPESTTDDGGFGRRWLVAFFGAAREFWSRQA